MQDIHTKHVKTVHGNIYAYTHIKPLRPEPTKQ